MKNSIGDDYKVVVENNKTVLGNKDLSFKKYLAKKYYTQIFIVFHNFLFKYITRIKWV